MAGAYKALVSLTNTTDLIQNHTRHSFSFDERQIGSFLEIARFFLEFIESNNSQQRSEEVKDLETQIASAARLAEDVLDALVVDQIHAGSTLDHGEYSPSYSSDLEEIVQGRMYSIKEKVEKLKEESRVKDEEPMDFKAAASSSRSPLTAGKSSVVGVDDYSLRLMDQLTSQQSSRHIIPIVGMGGMGKTTLAHKVYNDLLVKRHFDICAWATVSQEYDTKDILLQLLSRGGESTRETIDVLGEQLHKKLWGRRYLIILDDIWSSQAWDEVRRYIPDNGNGSRIVITTRLSDVATGFSSSSLAMKLLDEETSWKLFCERTLGKKEDCPFELVQIGKKIVEQCQGLPLAIVAIAGLLRKSSRTEEQWVEIAEDMISFRNSGEEQCLSILSLSYSHLLANLKPCFLYMGLFPQGKEILVSTLIRFWIAEGLIRGNGAQSLEEIGEGYLKDLVGMNLISVERKGWNGRLSTCRIHDLLRELCLRVGEEEKFFCVLKHPAAASRCRSMNCLICDMRRSSTNKDESRLLRIMPKAEEELDEDAFNPNCVVPLFNHLNMRYLFRHLYWERSSESLPLDRQRTVAQIRSRLPYIRLPSSISSLWNLQTLVIHGVFARILAPVEIWEMPLLRHVDIFDLISLPDPPPFHGDDDFVMQNLQTLMVVENFKLTEKACRRIPNIKELQMYYDLEAISRPRSEYNQHNLRCFDKLESLRCEFDEGSHWRDFALEFTFPISLKEMWLGGSGLHWEDLSMIGSLPNLEVLTLSCKNSVKGREWNSTEGEFQRLKSLTVYNCEDLVCWNVESSHFPVMEALTLAHAYKLVEFPSEVGDIPTLDLVYMDRCSVSAAVSAMRMWKEQEEMGNEDLRLEIQFKDKEELEWVREIVREEGLDCRNLLLNYFSIY